MKKKSFLDDDSNATLNPNMKVYPNPFPRKMASTIAFIEKNGLPPQIEKTKKSKKSTHSALQNELLTVYDFEPTEEQMLQLKAFLQQLFADKLNESKGNQEVATAG